MPKKLGLQGQQNDLQSANTAVNLKYLGAPLNQAGDRHPGSASQDHQSTNVSLDNGGAPRNHPGGSKIGKSLGGVLGQ